MRLLCIACFLILLCREVISGRWAFGEIEMLILNYHSKENNDSILYKNVINALDHNSRMFNETLCRSQFRTMLKAVEDREQWAIKVFDSWGKLPPAGLLYGTTADYGNFDECMAIAHDIGGDSNTFLSQYCLVSYPIEYVMTLPDDLHPPPSLDKVGEGTLTRGVCVPDTCSAEVLNNEFKEHIFPVTNITSEDKHVHSWKCARHQSNKFGTLEYVAILIFAAIIILMILSTWYEYRVNKTGEPKSPALMAFSVITNSKKLFKIQWKPHKDAIGCLNGIRVVSMLWIIWGHIFLNGFSLPSVNYLQYWKWIQRYDIMLVISSTIGVDTFFLLSGFLVTFPIFRSLEKRGKLTIHEILVMWIHRYLRFFPLLGATVLFSLTFLRYMADGPLWNSFIAAVVPTCHKYWWSAFLHVQNYVNPTKICWIHTWYLSADFQIYMLSPLILIPLYKWRRRFIPVIILLITASALYQFFAMVENKYTVRVIQDKLNPSDKYVTLLYYGAHIKAIPSLVGMLLSYIFHKQKESKLELPKALVLSGWICSAALIYAVVFGPFRLQQLTAPVEVVEDGIYKALSPLAWAIGVSWVIYACHFGYGGLVNSFLSFPIWQPCARLTYAIYLSHFVIQTVIAASTRTPVYFNTITLIQQYWAVLGFTIPISIFLVLALESPVIALEKRLLKPRTSEGKGNQIDLQSACPASNGQHYDKSIDIYKF